MTTKLKSTDGPPRRWTGPLTPLVILILLFAAGEGATRLAVWFVYGDANQAMGESLDYAPYLISLGDEAVLEFPAKDPETFRILVVGSSTAKQFSTEEIEEAFAPVIDRPLEVINLAQGGYILNQELVMLCLYGLQMEPDLLLTIDGVMDLVAMTKTGQAGIPYMDKRIRHAMTNPNSFAFRQMFTTSQLVNSLFKLKERRAEKAYLQDTELIDATVRMFGDNLLKFAQISSGSGIKYIGVLQPYLFLREELPAVEQDLSGSYRYRRDAMVHCMTEMSESVVVERFPPHTCFIDATAAFDNGPARAVQCFLDEAHLSEEGRRLLLEFIISKAVESGVLQNTHG
ncbi:MAG: hypothetical protein GY835_15320 [bacterium]|nr:hypothetical protein [bacterium]